MVKTVTGAKHGPKKRSYKVGYLILFFLAISLIGGFGYFFKRDALKHQKIQQINHNNLLEVLAKKDEEINALKESLLMIQDRQTLAANQSPTSNPILYKNKVSDNFQKIIMQQKLERRLLNGKDFSLELHALDALMGPSLRTSEFETLRRYATEGIPTIYDLEHKIRKQKPLSPQKQQNWILDLFSKVFSISHTKMKEQIESLISLIRQDRMEKSLDYIDEYFPHMISWKHGLEKRLEMKRALKKLEQLIYDNVRLA